MLIRLPRVRLNGANDTARFMLMSDLHIGSAHMDRDLLASDLQWAKDNNARVFIAGDVFDLILPKDHKRYNPEIYAPELHGGSSIINSTLKLGFKLLAPFADCIDVVGCGNHETAVQKFHATDVVAMLIESLQSKAKHKVHHGGYRGGITMPFESASSRSHGSTRMFNVFYWHGGGGSSAVTKGMIDFSRMATAVDGAHVLWMGHKHNRFADHAKVMEFAQRADNFLFRDQFRVMTGSYLDDDADKQIDDQGHYVQSWERERNFAPQGRGGVKLMVGMPQAHRDDNRRRYFRMEARL